MKNLKYITILLMFFALSNCGNHSGHDNEDGHDHSGHGQTEENHSDEEDHSGHGHTEETHSDTEEDQSGHGLSDEGHSKEGIEVSKEQFQSSKMLLGTITEQNFPEIVRTTGVIDVPPKNTEIISSFYEGFIKSSNLLVGDKVRKGQALVTIENPDFIDMQQEYLEIKEQMAYLKTEYERQQTLFNENISSQKKFQKAESEYKRNLVHLNGLRKKLQLLNINLSNVEQGRLTSVVTLYSSINGSVTAVNVNRGTHIDKADKIMEIMNTDHIHIELTVFEKDAMKIKKDQKIRFKIPEISDEYYDAEVHLVGKSINKESRTVVVHGHLHQDTKNTFNIGMFVDAEIEIVSNKAFALPEDAVVEEGEHQVVLKLHKEENDHYVFEQIEVEVGATYANFKEIRSNEIKKTDKFLVKGAFDMVGAGVAHEH